MSLSPNVAVNPLPWVLGPDGFDLSLANVQSAVAGIAAAGFTAMHSDVPAGMSVADYRTLLADHGVRPAPGYFGAHFDVDADEVPAIIEAAKAHAAMQAELGLGQAFLASHLNPGRIARPAVGADFDAARLDLIIERIAATARAISAEGVTPCFHPHVGSWIETEHEVRTLLDAVDAGDLSFGPDTGHLFWAAADPAALVRDYADRVRRHAPQGRAPRRRRPSGQAGRQLPRRHERRARVGRTWPRRRRLRRGVRGAAGRLQRLVRGRGRRPRPAQQGGVDRRVGPLDRRAAAVVRSRGVITDWTVVAAFVDRLIPADDFPSASQAGLVDDLARDAVGFQEPVWTSLLVPGFAALAAEVAASR